MTPAETLAKSRQLDGFLDRTVKEIRTMNKFAELASRSAAIRKNLEDRADRLAQRLDALPGLADATLGKHERMLDEEEEGIRLLEESLRGMIGHNGGPLPDSQGSSSSIEEALKPAAPEPAAEPAPPPVPAVDPTATGNPPA